jgi:hypothetical protein
MLSNAVVGRMVASISQTDERPHVGSTRGHDFEEIDL